MQIKHLFITISILLYLTTQGQNNKGIHFQGVARNNNGIILANKVMNIRLSIKNDSVGGVIEYQEIKSITTNVIGLFSVVVGSPENRKVISIGSFENISWDNAQKYLQIEIDVESDLSFVNLGTQKMNYVPFALYADKVDATNIQGITSIKKGGTGFDNLKDFKILVGIDKINNTPDSLKPTTQNTVNLINEKLKKSDTLTLSHRIDLKLNKSDTLYLSNRIQTKLNASDTNHLSTRISQKLNASDTNHLSIRIGQKLNTSDTNYLSNRIQTKLNASDTLKIYNKINQIPLIDTSSLSNRINLKLSKLDTSYLSNRIQTKLNASDTNHLSIRIGQKLNTSDTNYLSNRIQTKLNASDTIKIYNKINQIPLIDTSSLSNRINQKINIGGLTSNDILTALNYTPVPNDYGSFYDTAKQNTAVATASVVKFYFTNFFNNISITNNTSGLPSRITVANAGIYQLKYTLQFIKTDVGNDDISVWLRRNSAAIMNMNNSYTILGGNIKNTISNAFFVELGADDYVEIYFSVKNINTSMMGSNTQLSPSRPATPAATLFINRIN